MLLRSLLVAAAMFAAFAATPSAHAQNADSQAFFSQEWKLNPTASKLSLTTVKMKTVTETHYFTGLDGSVTPQGDARIEINLSSMLTGVDIRDVRMRFLFFETFKFPSAFIAAKIDKARLRDLMTGSPVTYPLAFTLDLHGVKKSLKTDVTVTRTGPYAVTVASVRPIVIQAADFDLTEGVNKLSQAMAGVEIVPSASVTFNFTFEGSANNERLAAVRNEAARSQEQLQTRELTAEECQNRMDVISKTRQIYFRTGSADINARESAPVLNEVAQFLNRCSAVTLEISGHTDHDGTQDFNQALSERRASAVANALAQRGVVRTRMKTIGFGFSRPVADNDTEAGKSQNRRIEFRREGAEASRN